MKRYGVLMRACLGEGIGKQKQETLKNTETKYIMKQRGLLMRGCFGKELGGIGPIKKG